MENSDLATGPEFEPLSPKQAAFVREYIIDLNGTQAAIRTGYMADAASVTASQLLAVPKIKAAVDKLKAQRASRVNVTADGVLHEMSLLANSSLEHYYVDDTGHVKTTPEAPEGAMRAISSMKRRKIVKEDAETGAITITYEVDIRLWDKPSSLKLMGRHVNLFPNRVEVTGVGGKPIELAHLTSEQLQAKALELSAQAAQITEGETVPDE